jgi:hypothetical protein
MKVHCNVIRDLLPLYYDGVCSEESKALVEDHLPSCEACRKELELIGGTYSCERPHPSEQKIAEAASTAWKRGTRSSFVKGVVIALAAIIVFCAIFVFPYTKQGMLSTVRFWEASLTQLADSMLEEDSNSAKDYWGYRVNAYPVGECVFFQHTGNRYTGFFYAAGGQPVGFQGTAAEFQKHGDGWLWKETDGDNWMYTEHIVGNWYWYEMHF